MRADLQTVLNRCLAGYRQAHTLSPRQAEVVHHIRACRTEVLGGVRLHCDHCAHEQPWYNACRDRHCPKCQWRATQAWQARQQANVLPVTYYHIVFTVPHRLNDWVARYPGVIYGLLFQSVWATLKAFGEDPKRLGGQLGATLVLHTWGQQLWRHVHLHCLVPGGALGPQGQWHAAKSSYLFPDRALARHVRGQMVSRLRGAYRDSELTELSEEQVDTMLDALMVQDWVVYTKPWLKRPEAVIGYLARYTFRTALSDARIQAVTGTEVALSYKDYRDRNRWKTLKLSGEELIRRFVQHVLPKGLMRIRHYGFLANRCRRRKLGEIRAALSCAAQAPRVVKTGDVQSPSTSWPCPHCHRGQLRAVAELAPLRGSVTLAPVRLNGG